MWGPTLPQVDHAGTFILLTSPLPQFPHLSPSHCLHQIRLCRIKMRGYRKCFDLSEGKVHHSTFYYIISIVNNIFHTGKTAVCCIVFDFLLRGHAQYFSPFIPHLFPNQLSFKTHFQTQILRGGVAGQFHCSGLIIHMRTYPANLLSWFAGCLVEGFKEILPNLNIFYFLFT